MKQKQYVEDFRSNMLSGKLEVGDFVQSLLNEGKVGHHIMQLILDDSGLEADLQLAFQWWPIFMENWLYKHQLEDTIDGYSYPDGVPDLTRDRTSEVDVLDGGKAIYFRRFDETVTTYWKATQLGDEPKVFHFTTQHVVMPDKRVLIFD